MYLCHAYQIISIRNVNCYHNVQIYSSSVGDLALTLKTYVKDTSVSCELHEASTFWSNGGVGGQETSCYVITYVDLLSCLYLLISILVSIMMMILLSFMNARNAQVPMHRGLEHVLGTCWKFERLIFRNFNVLIASVPLPLIVFLQPAHLSSSVSGVTILLHT